MPRLARLCVDIRAQGLGLGQALLRRVLALAIELRDRIGCVGVVTEDALIDDLRDQVLGEAIPL